MPSKHPTISMTIEEKLLRRLDRVARKLERTRSDLIRQMIRDGLEDHEVAAKAITNPVIMEMFAQAFTNREAVKAMAAVINEEVSDDQMALFGEMMNKLGEEASKRSNDRR